MDKKKPQKTIISILLSGVLGVSTYMYSTPTDVARLTSTPVMRSHQTTKTTMQSNEISLVSEKEAEAAANGNSISGNGSGQSSNLNIPGVTSGTPTSTGTPIPTTNSPTPTNGRILTMQYIGQYQDPWGNKQWGPDSGETILGNACILCASMMLSNFYTKHEYTSDEIINDASPNGYVTTSAGLLTTKWWEDHSLNASKYKAYTDFTASNVFDYVKQHIDADHPLLGNVHGHWCNQGTPSHTSSGCPNAKNAFHKTDGGHYFAIIGYDTKEGVDYIVIHDPGKGDGEYKYIAAKYWNSDFIGSDAPKKNYGCCPNGRLRACETK